jgi:hypothetical protein
MLGAMQQYIITLHGAICIDGINNANLGPTKYERQRVIKKWTQIEGKDANCRSFARKTHTTKRTP